jgi:hypothetical protein
VNDVGINEAVKIGRDKNDAPRGLYLAGEGRWFREPFDVGLGISELVRMTYRKGVAEHRAKTVTAIGSQTHAG